MSTKGLIMAVLLAVSVAINAMLMERIFERQCYQKGMADGARQLGEKLVAEVQKNQAINVKMADGTMVTLATPARFEKQMAAQRNQAQSPLPPGGRFVVPSKAAKEPSIDDGKGTIDHPQEVNKP